MPEEKLNIFLACILILGYLNYPMKKGMVRVNYMPWYDIIIMVAGAFPFIYFALNAKPYLTEFTVQNRGGKGVKCYKITAILIS